MTMLLPSPFLSACEMPVQAETAAALDASPRPAAELSLFELVERGFNVQAFMTDTEPPPLFLQRTG